MTDPITATNDISPDMASGYARDAAVNAVNSAIRQRQVESGVVLTAADSGAIRDQAVQLVDTALAGVEYALLVVGDEQDAVAVAAAVVIGSPTLATDYQLTLNDVTEGHQVIRRLAERQRHG